MYYERRTYLQSHCMLGEAKQMLKYIYEQIIQITS